MTRIVITLTAGEKDALRALAQSEFRDPRAQAALIIRAELERSGLLPPTEQQPTMKSQEVQGVKREH